MKRTIQLCGLFAFFIAAGCAGPVDNASGDLISRLAILGYVTAPSTPRYALLPNDTSGEAYTYRINPETGLLTFAMKAAVGFGARSQLISSDGRVGYVFNYSDSSISRLAVDPITAQFSVGATTYSTGTARPSSGPALHPTDRFVMNDSNGSGNGLQMFAVGSDGALSQVQNTTGVGYPAGAVFSRDGNNMYVYRGDAGPTNQFVTHYAVNTTTGAFTASGNEVATGAYACCSYQQIAIEPRFNSMVYNIRYGVNTVYNISLQTPTAPVLGDTATVSMNLANIAVHPSAPLAYATNSDGLGQIMIFSIALGSVGTQKGRLQEKSTYTIPGVTGARPMQIDKDGRFLFVRASISGQAVIVTLGVNTDSGGLTYLGSSPVTSGNIQTFSVY